MLPSSLFVDVISENNICGEIKYKIATAPCYQESGRRRILKALQACQIILHVYARYVNLG